MVEPVHPLQGGQFHGFLGLPRSPAVYQLSLVQSVDGFCQRVDAPKSPRLPTDGWMLASASLSVYLIETYWADSTGRGNTFNQEVFM